METLRGKNSSWREFNSPFMIGELKTVQAKIEKSALGKDRRCSILIKHLSEEGENKLLSLFNKVWKEGRVPVSCKDTVIIPITKCGKGPSKPVNY